MTIQLKNKIKLDRTLAGIRYLFFLIVIIFSVGSMELKAEETKAGNSGVERVELEMQPGFEDGVPVWQAQPGIDEWIFNYHYVYHENPAHMLNVMEYGKMTLKVYPTNEYSGINWKDWTVKTEWTVSGDADIVRLANEDPSSGYDKVPGTGRPEGTGSKVNYNIITETGEGKHIGPYYEENAVIIPTGKPGTCMISAKVVDKNGKEFTLPGKKITVKRWLDLNPDIKVTEVGTGRIVHSDCEAEGGWGLSGWEEQSVSSQTYTGYPITPKMEVTDKGRVLEEGKDYTISYINNVDVGYWTLNSRGAAILITGCGDYAGIIELHFSIYPNLNNQETNQGTTENKPALSCTRTYKKALDSKPFKISVKNASGKVSFSSSNKKVAAVNSNGTVTIKGTGLTKITVKASNGKAVSKVYVAPKKASIGKAKSTAKKTISLTWKKDTKASGYEIQCNTNKKFKSGNKTVTVKKAKTTSAKISKLKSGKKYYVRMRAYKTIEGKKYAGSWSKVLTVKVK